jgi:Ras GTPase-activating-like protein IQGAP2/3
MTSATPSVVGLHGRRQLKRTDSIRASKGNVALTNGSDYGWAGRNWMDKQRQFLQAYEYLCHIGEAKEWIEDIIHTPIPPIVQLEEALRDGVTLAEVVQALNPHRPAKIFRNPRLQFRHSDNIALFFRFLAEVELPELFRFELIDLYEKKNIPKVIYCIHALSWLLYRKGIVDFRIGNLVGQLEFEHHELEEVQRGLDRSGVSMPKFSGMGESFGAEPEPEPEPVESEENRINRELQENSHAIQDLQAQMRGSLIRMRLGDKMNRLWDSEHMLIELQSRIRGDWARQIVDYRLSMRRFAVNLQSSARGFLVRSQQRNREDWWKGKEGDVLKLQSLARGRMARSEIQMMKVEARREESGIKSFQAAIRGALARKRVDEQHEATMDASREVKNLQAALRGMLERKRIQEDKAFLRQENPRIATLQAIIRASQSRQQESRRQQALKDMSGLWRALQAVSRGHLVRDNLRNVHEQLRAQNPMTMRLQGQLRGLQARKHLQTFKANLKHQEESVVFAQSSIRGFLLRQKQKADRQSLQSHSSAIVKLQALSRACLLRKQVGNALAELDESGTEFVQLQALSRAMLLRLQVGNILNRLEAEEDSITELQSLMRGKLVRTRFEEKRRFFRENMEKVIKVQSIVRAKIQGEAYKSLTGGKNPPVGTLKGFVHLLNDSDFDFDEEIEFERLRKTVVQHVRQNEMADQYITQLDIKIALLVKNKITLDEVVKHQKHFGGSVGSLLPNTDMASKDPFDLRALNKNSRRKLEHYQELFFLLQTQPQYLARLFKRIREQTTAEKDCDRIKHLVMGLYGYAQKRREEYYLLKLISRSIREEVDASHSIQDYTRCNPFWNKLFNAYIKSPRDRKFMRDLLGGVIKENVIDNPDLDLESDPMQIYLSAINNEELRTGRPSHRRPNVPREEAIRDPETRETFIRHLQDLRDIADHFFLTLSELLHKMPFGIRFIAQQTFESLSAKFPNEDPGQLLQVAGQWVWKNYFQPALTEPEKFGVVDRGLTQEQKRNIGEVAKVLGQITAGRLFGGDNVYLQPLNSYVTESIHRLGEIWGNCEIKHVHLLRCILTSGQ